MLSVMTGTMLMETAAPPTARFRADLTADMNPGKGEAFALVSLIR